MTSGPEQKRWLAGFRPGRAVTSGDGSLTLGYNYTLAELRLGEALIEIKNEEVICSLRRQRDSGDLYLCQGGREEGTAAAKVSGAWVAIGLPEGGHVVAGRLSAPAASAALEMTPGGRIAAQVRGEFWLALVPKGVAGRAVLRATSRSGEARPTVTFALDEQ